MKEQLITLAIHTFEKAQILKTILESEGITTYIHNINQIQPNISAGVRVRIKESDLPHALRIIEERNLQFDEQEKSETALPPRILIPIDFSDYSMRACEIGINYAHQIDAEVMLLHVYCNTFIPSALPFISRDLSKKKDAKEEASLFIAYEKIQKDIEDLCAKVKLKIDRGVLPNVTFNYILREGLPEEEIMSYAEEYKPTLIIMGTRGKNKKNMDLIGSVTGEVIELTKVPLLTIPENTRFNNLDEVKTIAFATSFNQSDLIAFDRFIAFFKSYQMKIQLFNISTSKNEWNEIRLTGFNEYLKKHYPDLNIEYHVLSDGDILDAIQAFVDQQKIDLIAFSTHRRGLISRVFNPSIARKMLFHSNTQLLVLPN